MQLALMHAAIFVHCVARAFQMRLQIRMLYGHHDRRREQHVKAPKGCT